MVDTTQDTSHVLPSKTDDLSKILEPSLEHQENEESKNEGEFKGQIFEEDRVRTHETPEESYVYNVEEGRETTFAAVGVDENYVGTEDVLSRLKSGASDTPQESDIIFENSIAPIYNFTSFDHHDHKPQLSFAYKVDIQPSVQDSLFASQTYAQPLVENSLSVWRIDEMQQGDFAQKPCKRDPPSRPIKSPFLDEGFCQPMRPQSLPEKPILGFNEGQLFENYDQSDKLSSRFEEKYQGIRRPFEAKGDLSGITASQVTDYTQSLNWKENCFETSERPLGQIEAVMPVQVSPKPFGGFECLPLQPDKRLFDTPVLGGWKEGCFESQEILVARIQHAQPAKRAKNPFVGGICEPLPPHERPVDEFMLEGWKDGEFTLFGNTALEPQSKQTGKEVSKPINQGGYKALENTEAFDFLSGSKITDIFGQINKPNISANPIEVSQPVIKPISNDGGLIPMVGDKLTDMKPQLRLYGKESPAATPQSKPGFAIENIQADGLIYDNPVESLEAEEADFQPVFVVDFGLELSGTKTKKAKKKKGKKKKAVETEKIEEQALDETQEQTQEQGQEQVQEGQEQEQGQEQAQEQEQVQNPEEAEKSDAAASPAKKKKKKKVVKKLDTTDLANNTNPALKEHDMTKPMGLVPKIEKKIAPKAVEEVKTEKYKDEADGDNTFLNEDAINEHVAEKKTTVTIYAKIDDTMTDAKLLEKRRKDAQKNAVAETKSDNCKLCNMF